MKFITVLSTKGGVGKSTIASCLAEWMRDHGHRCAYFDMDPQGGSPVTTDRDREAEVCVVDTPGQLDEHLTPKWAAAADLVLVPTLCSPYDLPALERTLDVVRSHKKQKARYAVVVNRYDGRLKACQLFVDALRHGAGRSSTLLYLPDSTNYAVAAFLGKHAWRYRRQSPSAAALERLGRFCEQALDLEPGEEIRASGDVSEAHTTGGDV